MHRSPRPVHRRHRHRRRGNNFLQPALQPFNPDRFPQSIAKRAAALDVRAVSTASIHHNALLMNELWICSLKYYRHTVPPN